MLTSKPRPSSVEGAAEARRSSVRNSFTARATSASRRATASASTTRRFAARTASASRRAAASASAARRVSPRSRSTAADSSARARSERSSPIVAPAVPTTSEARREQPGDGHDAMTPGELARAVEERRRGRLDGPTVEEALDVLGEGTGGGIAARRVLLQTAHHDPVQVGGEVVDRRMSRLVAAGSQLPATRARTRRVLREDGLPQLPIARAPHVEGRLPDEQLVEQHPQRVHVGPRVDVRTRLELLGAHVRRSADGMLPREVVGDLVQRRRRGLGDTEVDDLRLRVAVDLGDQDVRRLEVAVDHSVLVRVLDGQARRTEEPQARARVQLLLDAVFGDGRAVDQLHHEVRPPRLGGPGVEDASDARVVHARQDGALRLEARHHLQVVRARLDELQRDLTLERLLLPGTEDDAEAAFPETLEQLVGTDAITRGGFDERDDRPGQGVGSRPRRARAGAPSRARRAQRRRGSPARRTAPALPPEDRERPGRAPAPRAGLDRGRTSQLKPSIATRRHRTGSGTTGHPARRQMSLRWDAGERRVDPPATYRPPR